jgi:protein-S-isoprenylcysteine O-methyltransferase Ste14
MKIRFFAFLLEWILANTLVLKILDDSYSFYTVPWVLWNITFGIFLFKLFTAPEDDGSVWPIGPTVGAFGFALTAVKVGDAATAWHTYLGYAICVFGFATIGISSDALGDEWRDAPPPESGTDATEKSKLVATRQSLVTSGPYGVIRHPIYCGLLLEALGSNVVGGFSSAIALVAFVSVAAAYVFQLTQEERELNILLDGKYDSDYKQTTEYKLVPFLF